MLSNSFTELRLQRKGRCFRASEGPRVLKVKAEEKKRAFEITKRDRHYQDNHRFQVVLAACPEGRWAGLISESCNLVPDPTQPLPTGTTRKHADCGIIRRPCGRHGVNARSEFNGCFFYIGFSLFT